MYCSQQQGVNVASVSARASETATGQAYRLVRGLLRSGAGKASIKASMKGGMIAATNNSFNRHVDINIELAGKSEPILEWSPDAGFRHVFHVSKVN